MQLDITGHSDSVSQALREYITKKFDKLHNHFERLIVSIHVTLKVIHLSHIAAATVHVRGAELYADAEAENMYAAVDSLVDKLNETVRKHKEKHSSHR